MEKKRYFRYSKGLQASGVTESWHHIIYGIVTNPKRTERQNRTIKEVCQKAAGRDAAGLYRFLTDQYIDHNYIYREYFIRPASLFEYRVKFYTEFQKHLGKDRDFFDTERKTEGVGTHEKQGKSE